MSTKKPRSPVPQSAQKDPTSSENIPELKKSSGLIVPAEKVVEPEPEAVEADELVEPEPREPLDTKQVGDDLRDALKADPRQSVPGNEARTKSAKRRTRIPMGRHQKLDAIAAPYRQDFPDFYMRYALDKPGRIEQYLAAGYDFVLDYNGQHVTFPSGNFHLRLMKLPQEYRDDDLRNREQEISNRMVEESTVADDEYTPDHGGKAGAGSALTVGSTFEPAEENS